MPRVAKFLGVITRVINADSKAMNATFLQNGQNFRCTLISD